MLNNLFVLNLVKMLRQNFVATLEHWWVKWVIPLNMYCDDNTSSFLKPKPQLHSTKRVSFWVNSLFGLYSGQNGYN